MNESLNILSVLIDDYGHKYGEAKEAIIDSNAKTVGAAIDHIRQNRKFSSTDMTNFVSSTPFHDSQNSYHGDSSGASSSRKFSRQNSAIKKHVEI